MREREYYFLRTVYTNRRLCVACQIKVYATTLYLSTRQDVRHYSDLVMQQAQQCNFLPSTYRYEYYRVLTYSGCNAVSHSDRVFEVTENYHIYEVAEIFDRNSSTRMRHRSKKWSCRMSVADLSGLFHLQKEGHTKCR